MTVREQRRLLRSTPLSKQPNSRDGADHSHRVAERSIGPIHDCSFIAKRRQLQTTLLAHNVASIFRAFGATCGTNAPT